MRNPWFIVACLVLAQPSPARAQSPYENYLVGDRSLGLAGAFVGLADDATAGFHNPAGLAMLPGSTFSGSLWSVALESRSVAGGFHTGSSGRDLHDVIVRPMPFFAAGALKLGDLDAAGVRPHALGVVIAQPYREDLRFHAQHGSERPDGFVRAGRLQIQQVQFATWVGLAYAYRVSRKLALGVTTFLTHHVLRHTESELQAVEAPRDALPATVSHARSLDVIANSSHLLWRFGVLYDHDPRWRFGLMLQPPGARIRGDGHVSQLRTRVDPDGSSTTLGHADDLSADAPRPWEVRIGTTWYSGADLLTFDMSMLGPVPDDDTFIRQVKEITGDDVRLASHQERLVTLRGALGAEHVFGGHVPVRGGVLYERHGLARTPRRSTTFVLGARHTVGLAVSVGYRGRGYDLSLGTTWTMGLGSGLGLHRSDDLEDATFVATGMRTHTVFVFLSGGASAAARIARDVLGTGD
jgi:hypothetical protein